MNRTIKTLTNLTILACFLFIAACNTNKPDQSSADKELAEKCCKECIDAFSQSPVGVGAAGVRCGEFTTAKPLSKKCMDYFKANPKTVAECE